MPLRVVDQTRGLVIADRADIANTNEKRRRGLLDRTFIRQQEGLWIVPCASIHTVGMNFPIDVLFIDHSGRIVQIEPVLNPGCKHFSASAALAYSVLELAPGRAAACGAEAGDVLLFQRS